MQHISIEELATKLGQDAVSEKAAMAMSRNAADKLESGRCTTLLSHVYGKFRDSSSPHGHKHFCIDIEIELAEQEHRERGEKFAQEHQDRLNKAAQEAGLPISAEISLHSALQGKIKDVIVYDNCDEYYMRRGINDKKAGNCEFNPSQN